MDFNKLIAKRRSKRSMKPVEIDDKTIEELYKAASLAPSCYNKQPWRYVFIYEEKALKEIFTSLAEGNAWAKKSSMIIAVVSGKELDCSVHGIDYYGFDTGMSTMALMLKAAELGLLTHAMAGFSQEKAKEVLKVPEELDIITLIAVGKSTDEIDSDLTKEQVKIEKKRPQRKKIEEIIFKNKFK